MNMAEVLNNKLIEDRPGGQVKAAFGLEELEVCRRYVGQRSSCQKIMIREENIAIGHCRGGWFSEDETWGRRRTLSSTVKVQGVFISRRCHGGRIRCDCGFCTQE